MMGPVAGEGDVGAEVGVGLVGVQNRDGEEVKGRGNDGEEGIGVWAIVWGGVVPRGVPESTGQGTFR